MKHKLSDCSYELPPAGVLSEDLGVAHHDHGVLGPGERHVEPLPVRKEPDAPLAASDTGDEDDILLTPLEPVHSVDHDPGPSQLLILKLEADVGLLFAVESDQFSIDKYYKTSV